MKILSSMKKVPGGLMICPMFLGAIINTFFPNVWGLVDGTFTTYLWRTGTMPFIAAFLFCNATTIEIKSAGKALYKGVVITTVKVGLGIITGLLCRKIFGDAGFLGISTLAIIGALANSNGGLYAALAGEYGDATDVGAVSILSINDGPFFTMVALGAAGIAKIPFSILVGCVIPIIVGCILGNLDKDLRDFFAPGATLIIPIMSFPLGASLNLGNVLKAGGPGIVLGVFCTLITGVGGYIVYKILRMDHPEVGAAAGTCAGNAMATPASVAAVDATLLVVAESATIQITAAVIVTAILCPLLVSFLHKIETRNAL